MPTRSLALALSLLTAGALSCVSRRPLEPVQVEVETPHGPWADEEAENLAWLISGKTWAPRDVYERVRADLSYIRDRWADSITNDYYGRPGSQWGRVVLICEHRPRTYPATLWIDAESETKSRIKAGTYHDWDSLNTLFKAGITPESDGYPDGATIVTTIERVNPYRLAEAYERLPGMNRVTPSFDNGQAGGFNVCARQFTWGIGYLFSMEVGICGLLCPPNYYYYFRSFGDRIIYEGSCENPGQVLPSWWDEATACLDLYEQGDDAFLNRDVIPPPRITDLSLDGPQFSKVATISFTAPSDNHGSGQVNRFQIRWGIEPATDENWWISEYKPETGGILTVAAGPTGTTAAIKLTKLLGDTTNYISVRSIDGRGNASQISNEISSRNTLLNGWTHFSGGADGLPIGAVNALLVDSRGDTWAATTNGVARYSGGTWRTFTVSDGIPSDYTLSLAEDHEGNIWAGTLRGASWFDGSRWTNVLPVGVTGGSNEVRSILVADDSTLWMGVGFGGAGHLVDGNWTWYSPSNCAIGGTVVKSIIQSYNGRLWFATNEGISRFDDLSWTNDRPNTGTSSNYILSLLETSDRAIWSASQTGALAIYDAGTWTSRSSPRTGAGGIAQTSFRDVWLAGEGIRWCVAGDPDSVISLSTANSRLPERGVTAIASGPGNVLWIGTKLSGVCRWDLSAIGLHSSERPDLARR